MFLLAPGAAVAAFHGYEPHAARAQVVVSGMRRAHAEWTTVAESGRNTVVYVDGMKAVSALGEERTTAFVGRISCPARAGDGGGSWSEMGGPCIGAAKGKVVRNEAFVVDPSLSTATLDVRLLNMRQSVEWQGQGMPEMAASEPPDGSGVTLHASRSAAAAGRVFGDERSRGASSVELTMQQSVTAGAGAERMAAAGTGPGAEAAAAAGLCGPFTAAEREFHTLTNRARAAKGKSHLRLDPELTRVARRHTDDMIAKDLLHHQDSGAFGRRVTRWKILGENVGVGPGVGVLQDAFMNSPPHRKNIMLSGFRHVGVGVRENGAVMWVTVIFEARRDPGTSVSC